MKRQRLVLVLLLLTGSRALAEGPADRIVEGLLPPVSVRGAPDALWSLDARMASHHVPGVSVAFFDQGKITWTVTRGFADVATRKPVKPDTLFQAGAISQLAATVAALRLARDSQLDLDGDVNARLVTWNLPENAVTAHEKVTPRRLLNHTAGVTVDAFKGYAAGELLPTIAQVLDGQPPANNEFIRVDTEPGSEARHSAGGFVLLQLLLADVTRRPAAQALRELALVPAGMSNSSFEQPWPRSKAARVATPYDKAGSLLKGGWRTYPELAANGLWSTPSDLVRLAGEIGLATRGKSTGLLSAELAAAMLEAQEGQQGLGVEVAGEGDGLHFWLSGTNAGYRAWLVAYPARGQALAVMTNGEDGLDLIWELQRAVSREYGWPHYKPQMREEVAVPPAMLSLFAGAYEQRGLRLVFEVRGGRLILRSPTGGSEVLELFPSGPTTFFDREGIATVRFRGEGNRATAVEFEQEGSLIVLPRAPSVTPPP